ncbi:MAG TPA: energy transducer TonB, partial [Bacteroidales bacterium]|nr:energy transducer TonB [Bacteroidales bacterium]
YGEKAKDGVIEITTKDKVAMEDAAKDAVADKAEVEPDKDVFVVVEEMPQFPGGQNAMFSWIAGEVVYPAEAVKDKISGRVIVYFVVTASGKIKNVKVERSAHPLLDAEAVRVIGMMPEWKPGHQRGKAVDVAFAVPVEFSLQGEKVIK